MPIYLDISPAVHAKAGLSRYSATLAQTLLQQAPGRFAFFYNRSGASSVPAWLKGQKARSVRAGYKPWRMAVWLGQLARLGLDRLVPGCELFHGTEHLLLPLRGCPTVLTVHDLIFNIFPQHHKRLNRWYLNAALPLYCRRADAIICVSQRSKNDLVRTWGVDPGKVKVIYEAASPRFCLTPPEQVAAARARYSLPERYMVTVGTIEPRKNLGRLLEALKLLRQEGEDIRLVIVGSLGWLFQDFMAQLERFEPRQAVLLPGFVPDEDLPAVYAGAALSVLPSLYEGFGLPILESMACGTPVVCSQAASLPELGGDAARYFDPKSVRDMAAAIGEVWRDEGLSRDMRRRGLAQAAQFSWERTARETMQLYERVLG